MRILAVDDDQNVLDLLQVILSADANFKLELVSSPRAALQAINGRIQKFDCILLDIMMPEMDGITLCQKIRTNPRYGDTPIIMLTAKSDEKSIKSAFSAGATDYVGKPFDIHEVSARVRVASELSSARNEIRALRCRAKIDKRNIKAETSDKFGVAGNETRELPQLEKAEIRCIAGTSEGGNNADCLARSDVLRLFSKDFSDHSHLHRSRKRKQAC